MTCQWRGKHQEAERRMLGRAVHRRVRPEWQAHYQEPAGQDLGGGESRSVRSHHRKPAAGRIPLGRVHGGRAAAGLVRAVHRQAQHPTLYCGVLQKGGNRAANSSPHRSYQAEQTHQTGNSETVQDLPENGRTREQQRKKKPRLSIRK